MHAADIMTRDPATVRVDAPLSEAVQLMLDRRISGLPVIGSDGRLVGMLTESDLLQRAETETERHAGWLRAFFTPGRLAEDFVHSHGRRVGEVMTPDVVGVAESTPLAEVVALMRDRRVRRLPVLRDDRLVGIVSRVDLIRALAAVLQQVPPKPGTDAEMRQAIYAALGRQAWAPRTVRVGVTDGRVTLDGTIFDERDRQAIRVAAENVPGVKSVEDRLVWVEPESGMVIAPDAMGTPM